MKRSRVSRRASCARQRTAISAQFWASASHHSEPGRFTTPTRLVRRRWWKAYADLPTNTARAISRRSPWSRGDAFTRSTHETRELLQREPGPGVLLREGDRLGTARPAVRRGGGCAAARRDRREL